jgi:hypothetical protein
MKPLQPLDKLSTEERMKQTTMWKFLDGGSKQTSSEPRNFNLEDCFRLAGKRQHPDSEGGTDAPPDKKAREHYKQRTADNKSAVVLAHRAGKSLADIQRDLGVPKSTAKGWIDRITAAQNHMHREMSKGEIEDFLEDGRALNGFIMPEKLCFALDTWFMALRKVRCGFSVFILNMVFSSLSVFLFFFLFRKVSACTMPRLRPRRSASWPSSTRRSISRPATSGCRGTRPASTSLFDALQHPTARLWTLTISR